MCNKPERHIPQGSTRRVDGGPPALGAHLPISAALSPDGTTILLTVAPEIGARLNRVHLALSGPATNFPTKKTR